MRHILAVLLQSQSRMTWKIGQRSLCMTHPLMLLIICAQYGNNPSGTVGVTKRTQNAGRTDWQTYGVKTIYPQQLRFAEGIITQLWITPLDCKLIVPQQTVGSEMISSSHKLFQSLHNYYHPKPDGCENLLNACSPMRNVNYKKLEYICENYHS